MSFKGSTVSDLPPKTQNLAFSEIFSEIFSGKGNSYFNAWLIIGVTIEVFKLKTTLRLEKDFLIIFIYSALPGLNCGHARCIFLECVGSFQDVNS